MEGRQAVKPTPRVLIVDESTDSREVLRLLVERLGATTLLARRPEQALQIAQDNRVDLILLDADSDCTASGDAVSRLQVTATRNDTPIVILGSVCRSQSRYAAGQFVAKPYQYAELARKIDGVLAAA
jgi:CheY-like chemotaxis protein